VLHMVSPPSEPRTTPVAPKPSLVRTAPRKVVPTAPHAQNDAAPAITPAAPAEATLPPVAEPSLLERARAQISDANRAIRADENHGPSVGIVKLKPLPPTLAKLPEEVKTALQKSFDDYLGEEVVLDVHEHQEGNNRVTMIHTNKRRYCVYEPLLAHAYQGNVPSVTRIGTCGPQS